MICGVFKSNVKKHWAVLMRALVRRGSQSVPATLSTVFDLIVCHSPGLISIGDLSFMREENYCEVSAKISSYYGFFTHLPKMKLLLAISDNT